MIDFNINNNVYVKLTDVGKSELKKQHDELNEFVNGILGEYTPPIEDSEGWSKWQLWCLMKKLGVECGQGCKVPFETGIRIDIPE